MQIFKNIVLTVAFAMTAIGPAIATGQELRGPARRVTGNIIEINRTSRVLKIQDSRTGIVVTARVPDGQLITLRENANPGSMPRLIPFELAIRGLVVDVLVVNTVP